MADPSAAAPVAQEQPVADAPAQIEASGQAGAEGEGELEAGMEYVMEEKTVEVHPILIRFPAPSHAQTLPPLPAPTGSPAPTPPPSKKANAGATAPSSYPSTLTLHPQAAETVQDLRATIAEWPGSYWLGPYSLRIPRAAGAGEGEGDAPARGRLLGTAKEGMEVREGEKLSEWLEVGEVFAHLEEDGGEQAAEKKDGEKDKEVQRVLEVQLEPYSESDARQAFLRLRDYTIAAQDAAQPFISVGINPGASIFEGIRDGTIVDPELPREDADAHAPSAAAATARAGKGAGGAAAAKQGKGQGRKPPTVEPKPEDAPFANWKGWAGVDIAKLPTALPPAAHAQCVRSLLFSPFNPPPPHLKQRGHLVYLTVVTLEGESAMLVCTTRGWHVARTAAPNAVFDPAPRTAPKRIAAHSLIDVLHGLSPLFTSTLRSLQAPSPAEAAREPIATVPIPQHPPAYPWLATAPVDKAVTADPQRMQLAYGYTGATTVDGLEGARDWNEEIQNARELPRGTTQERILRERVLQKTHAEFTAASVRAVMAIARGDYPPINPHEDPKAHMHLISNIFVTKAVNSVDAYTHLGGDEAAHVSHAKDAAGVKLLNKLDIDNVYLLGHTVVDWQGERWVCQSVLPGIFSRRRDDNEGLEDDERDDIEAPTTPAPAKEKEDWVEVNGASPAKTVGEDSADAAAKATPADADSENFLIIYGADSEGGLDNLHWDAGMHKIMRKVAAAQRLALHKMSSTAGVEHEFWTSVDVKGLRGSDGRRYLLDLPRLSPVDIEWLEHDMGKGEAAYPHRVALLRPELIETYWEHSLKTWARKVQAEKAEKAGADKAAEGGEAGEGATDDSAAKVITSDEPAEVGTEAKEEVPKKFELRFNADAFVEQPAPGRDGEREDGAALSFVPESQRDESDPSIKAVRDASQFLRNVAIPAMLIDVVTSNSFSVIDGASLSKQMHLRGINMRYLGVLLQTIEKSLEGKDVEGAGLLRVMKTVVQQEMVFRACKHILRDLVRGLLAEHQICAVAHFLNCLLGAKRTSKPTAVYEPLDFAKSAAPAYTQLTPEALRSRIIAEVQRRFQFTLNESYLVNEIKSQQMLRELAVRFAFQLQQRQYYFGALDGGDDASATNSEEDKENVPPNRPAKKSKAQRAVDPAALRPTSFKPSDIIALLPVIKSCAPSATIAEEVFQTGHNSINHGNVAVGLELMLEGINFYEQIHSVVHPEVAAAYNTYAVLMHSLVRIRLQQIALENAEEEPPLGLDLTTAIRLQRQAIMAAERTLGQGHAETISYYFNLAMLEHLNGNHLAAMRYLKHDMALWDMAFGPEHPELATLMSNVAVVLQAAGQHASCLAVLRDVHSMQTSLFGAGHITCANSLSQLTQAHFLSGDIASAAEAAKAASEIYTAQLGAEDAQAKDAAKNAELLNAAVEQRANQQQAIAAAQQGQQQQQQQSVLQRLQQQRQRSLANGNGQTKAPANATASSSKLVGAETVSSSAQQVDPRIGEKGHMDVDSLVKFIQGSQGAAGGQGAKSRGKNALRGKKRTGAKR